MTAAILVADNDPGVNALLCEVLRRRGLRVASVADGEAALRAWQRDPADVLVCDLDMPRLDGLALLRALAAGPEVPRAAVVVSGFVDGPVRGALEALPFVREVFRKPFDLLAFAARVGELAGGDGAAGEVP